MKERDEKVYATEYYSITKLQILKQGTGICVITPWSKTKFPGIEKVHVEIKIKNKCTFLLKGKYG